MTHREFYAVSIGACASIFLLLVIFGMRGFASSVQAAEPPCEFCADEVCPELKDLKSKTATIGGNAWNTTLGWIYHQWPADDLSSRFRVQKLPENAEKNQTGAEIAGWSSYNRPACKAQRAAGAPQNCPSICWGKTCGSADSIVNGWNNNSPKFCNDPSAPECMLPPWDQYPRDKAQFPKQVAKGAYAELDYAHPEKIYTVVRADTTTVTMTPEQVVTLKIAKNKRTLSCRYPVNGWLKIRQLKEDGWVKLSGRIYSNSVPVPPVPATDPGPDYVNWPGREDCIARPDAKVCKYQVMYDPAQKEFVGWAWSPRVRWISFSGSTNYTTGSEWFNKSICGKSCTIISYDEAAKKSKWNSSFIGVWVQALGGNLFAKKGFSGVSPPPGKKNTPYLIVTGQYTENGTPKSGAVTSWEGACDDKKGGACSNVGRESASTKSPAEQRVGALSGLSFPTNIIASALAQRSFIKRNILGTINTEALFPSPNELGEKKNKFGNLIKPITASPKPEEEIWGILSDPASTITTALPLGGKIFFYDGDLLIGSDTDRVERVIMPALGTSSGAGTVVVRGNLVIKRPLAYGRASVTNFKQLASISWIVLKRKSPTSSVPSNKPVDVSDDDWKAGGNIIIDNCIPGLKPEDKPEDKLKVIANGQQLARVVGTFFAENVFTTGTGRGGEGAGECGNLGNPFTTTVRIFPERGDRCSGTQKTDPKTEEVTCTSTQTQYYDVPLEIEGVVVAKKLLFQRVFRGRNRGSEVISNTGRMVVNPPPGLGELSKSLPLW